MFSAFRAIIDTLVLGCVWLAMSSILLPAVGPHSENLVRSANDLACSWLKETVLKTP
jgi:hypothetical protein